MTATPNRSYYPALDGLRGIAILLVVVYHNFGFVKETSFGWLGVDLFFVLSGYLITDILLKEVAKPHFLRNFYMRRVLRIFPLYYFSLVLLLFIVAPLTADRIEWKYYQDNQFFLWTYLQNWLYIFKDPGRAQILNHYWSLAVEEQFYIFWPLVILLLRKPKALLLFICILLLGVILFRFGLWMYKVENLAYYNLYTFTRIDGICIGCIVALLMHMKSNFIGKQTALIVLAFAAINFLFYLLNSFNEFSFPYIGLVGYTTFAMLFGLLLHDAVTGETKIIGRMLNLPILKFFGRISYGFYIFHWPVYLLMGAYLLPLITNDKNSAVAKISISVVATLVAIVISVLSRRYFEGYFLKKKEKFSASNDRFHNKQP